MFRFTALLLALCGVFLTGGPGDDIRPVSSTFDPDTQPFAFVVPQLPLVEGTTGLKASDCGTCHQKIYKDWSGSTHAHALSDLQFLAEISKPDSPRWLCLNCHIPVQNQRENVVLGLVDGDVMAPHAVPNKDFDKAFQLEGISCSGCHVRIDLETGKSFVIGPNGSDNSPHPVRVDRAHLRNICQRCHEPKGESITPNLVCWFHTSAELDEGQAELRKVFGVEKDCVDCHMPEEDSPVAEAPPGLPSKQLNRHYWMGGGVPKESHLFDNLLEQGFQSGLDVAVRQSTWDGDALRISVELTNARAGHYVPTGDPERFILTVVTVTAANGDIMKKETRRVGQVWEWNPARKVSDNRIKMGETRTQLFEFAGIDKSEVGHFAVEVLHVKLTSANVSHMMETRPIVDDLYPDAPARIRTLNEHYPTALVIHSESFDRQGQRTGFLTPEQRVERSRRLVDTPLGDRGY